VPELPNQEVRIVVLEKAYENLDRRMDKIDDKLDDLQEQVKNSNNSMMRVVIASAGTIVGSVLSVLVVMMVQNI
tara:strand:+ start:1100 stop:1321 length:222 start_codon:yes stop_codon:yes gene_type:complete